MGPNESRPEAIHGTWTAALRHEEIFLQRYQTLRSWALRLAGNLADADDLLHDAFLQFILRRRDLSEIESIDAYLCGMLRRLRLSKRRAVLRAREDPLRAIDYDTAELSLRAADPHDDMRLRAELRQVCRYACQRKETSRSGSVLLLRFFHGFFPGEIARILKSPLRGANDWVRIARREAREYLADPAHRHAERLPDRTNGADAMERLDPLHELREMIWLSRRGDCVSSHELALIYASTSAETLSCPLLAHVVSCPDCLARVATLNGMRGPIDRDPHDTLRQDTSWRFIRGASSRLAARLPSQLRRWEDALRTVHEHVPRELRVAANGLPIGACSVNATECTFTLTINIDEPLDFIEVFSEQGVRLLLWEIEPAPTGDVDQAAHIDFGGGRSMSVAAHFNAHWPSLEITYRDPEWVAESGVEPESAVRVVPLIPRGANAPALSRWQRLRARLAGPLAGVGLRPVLAGFALAALVALGAAALWRTETVSAAQILADARSLEVATAAAPSVAVYRVLQLEERRLPDGVVLTRRRIEGWHSGRRGLTARRVYDDRGRLVAGEWVRRDGTRTIYASGQPPRSNGDLPEVVAASIWQFEPSAEGFERLVGTRESAQVRGERDRYTITYRTALEAERDGLIEATLVVTKHAMRPIAQRLVIRERGRTTQFDFTETVRTEVPESTVAEATFQPEPELLAPAAANRPAAGPAPSVVLRPTVDTRGLDRLEIDLLVTLHRLESCLDTPATLAASEATIAVTARVVSDDCRDRVRRAVETAARDGAQTIVTFAPANAPLAASGTTAELDALPAYRTLIARFGAAGLHDAPGGTTAREAATIAARAFGTWALEHAARAHEEMLHLDRITTRWSVGTLAALDVDRVARYQDVVRDHARRFRRESEALRAQLGSLLSRVPEPPSSDERDGTITVRSLEQARPAVVRLLDLAAAHHDAVRQLFDPRLTTPRVPVDVAALTTSLHRAEAQAGWFDEPWALPAESTRD